MDTTQTTKKKTAHRTCPCGTRLISAKLTECRTCRTLGAHQRRPWKKEGK